MLYWKSWCETRKRFYFGLFITLLLSGLIFYEAQQADPNKAPSPDLLKDMLAMGFQASQRIDFLWYETYTLTVGMIASWIGVMLAGAGLNTQTTYGMWSGPHPSMLFTLSLPVHRRELVLSRSLLGAGLSVVLTFLPALLFPMLSLFFTQRPMSFQAALVYSGMAAIASMVFYWVSVLLATFLDEQWQLYGAWIVVTTVVLLGRFKHLPVFAKLVDLGLSVNWVRDQSMPWATIAVCLCFCITMMIASIKVAEQRQY